MTDETTPTPPVALKACPFCGGDRARTVHIRDGRQAQCPCGGSAKPVFHGRLDQLPTDLRAIAAWNQRATPDAATCARDYELEADGYKWRSGKQGHASDCATSVAPAMAPGPCDCDAPNATPNATPDAAAMREACAKVADYAVERAERDWRNPDKQDAVKQVGAEIAEVIRALPLASTEAGIGAGEGESHPAIQLKPAPASGVQCPVCDGEGCQTCGGSGRIFPIPEYTPKPPAALDEHRARIEEESQTLQWQCGWANGGPIMGAVSEDYRRGWIVGRLATSPRASGDRLREAGVEQLWQLACEGREGYCSSDLQDAAKWAISEAFRLAEAAARSATLPANYQWSEGNREKFDFGRDTAADAIAALRSDDGEAGNA